MRWYFEDSGFRTGYYNMAFDLFMASHCNDDEAFLRLYRWKPYCISLGYNQPVAQIKEAQAKSEGIDIIRRPTGGRAILHSEELTYAVAMPLKTAQSPHTLYKDINMALLKGLSIYDATLTSAELEEKNPSFRNLYKTEAGMACFASSAKNELKFDKKKLIGSAQRKIGDRLLQHGSLLAGRFHRKLIEYLHLTEDEKATMNRHFEEKTTEMETVLGKETNYDRLAESIQKGFTEHFDIDLHTDTDRFDKLRLAMELEENKERIKTVEV